jgi:CheY-like chemotaxis protein
LKHVLVIDDEQYITRLLARVLAKAGYKTTVAGDGKEGVQRFREDPADVVIVDIFMPDMDGLEVIRELRKDFPQARFIAISGGGQMGMPDFLPTARKLGAQHILQKPIKNEKLLQTIKEVLSPQT